MSKINEATDTPIQPELLFDVEKIKTQLRVWADRLLDLKKSNPLLGINRSRVSKLFVKSPDPAVLFKMMVVDEGAIKLPLILIKKKKHKKDELQIELEDITHPDKEPEIVVHPGDVEFEGEFKIQQRLIKESMTMVRPLLKNAA